MIALLSSRFRNRLYQNVNQRNGSTAQLAKRLILLVSATSVIVLRLCTDGTPAKVDNVRIQRM
jgi:hypothetical protein